MAVDVEPYSLCINNTRAQDWVYHVVRTTTLPTVAIGIYSGTTSNSTKARI